MLITIATERVKPIPRRVKPNVIFAVRTTKSKDNIPKCGYSNEAILNSIVPDKYKCLAI